jgi:DNA-binding transcriptional ArsR family regulator
MIPTPDSRAAPNPGDDLMTEEDDIATDGDGFEEDELSESLSTVATDTEPQPKPKRGRPSKKSPAKAAPKKSAPKSPAPRKASARAKKANGVASVASRDYRDVSLKLKQAADPTRIAILLLLDDGPRNVGAICSELGISSQPAISHHLALCRYGGLVLPDRQGKKNFYALTDKGKPLVAVIRSLMALAD